jgi:hypothetical protein
VPFLVLVHAVCPSAEQALPREVSAAAAAAAERRAAAEAASAEKDEVQLRIAWQYRRYMQDRSPEAATAVDAVEPLSTRQVGLGRFSDARAKWGADVLFCMPDRTSCILLVSVM